MTWNRRTLAAGVPVAAVAVVAGVVSYSHIEALALAQHRRSHRPACCPSPLTA